MMRIYQAKWIFSNDDQGRRYKNCKCNDPQGRDCCARAWPHQSLKFFFSTLKKRSDELITPWKWPRKRVPNWKCHDSLGRAVMLEDAHVLVNSLIMLIYRNNYHRSVYLNCKYYDPRESDWSARLWSYCWYCHIVIFFTEGLL